MKAVVIFIMHLVKCVTCPQALQRFQVEYLYSITVCGHCNTVKGRIHSKSFAGAHAYIVDGVAHGGVKRPG